MCTIVTSFHFILVILLCFSRSCASRKIRVFFTTNSFSSISIHRTKRRSEV
jgi:hypothetical protein